MSSASVQLYGGIPSLFIDGEPQVEMAYMTYFDKDGMFEDFYRAGYRISCLCVYFGDQIINPANWCKPFAPGYSERQERRISLMSNGASQICSVRHTLHLPEKRKMTPLFAERAPIVSDCVELNLRRGQFAAFRLDQPDEAPKRFSDKITNHLYRR